MVPQNGSLISGEALPYGWRLVVLSEIDSTNDEVRRRQDDAPADGLAVLALQQTAGRGRRGRHWSSPIGNMYLSVRLTQAKTLSETALLSFVSAVALSEAILDAAPHIPLSLKWPNDVLVAGGKVSGILLETEGDSVILGIGVNLAHAPEAADALYPPTALTRHGLSLAPEDFARLFLRHLAKVVALWRAQGMAAILPLWLKRAHGLGAPLIARLHDGLEVHGTFEAIDADGALLIRCDDGTVQRILAADVFFSSDGRARNKAD